MSWIVAVTVAALLTGCVSNARPPPPSAAIAPPLSWREEPSGSGAIDPRWWRAFGDPQIDRLVDAALIRNADVLTAIARVDEARARVRLARSALLPQLSAFGGGTQAHAGGADVQTIDAGVDATWDVDLFGRLRALSEAARRTYVASQADRDATALSVSTQTVQIYFGLLALDAQIQLTQDTIRTREKSVSVAEDQAKLGYTSRLEFLQSRADYQTVEAQLAPQRLAQRQQENALAILSGDLPQPVIRARNLVTLQLPVVPATLPSELLRRRPDIASAEYRLAASDSIIAAQRAAYLPSLSLTGGYSQTLSSVISFNPSTLWSIGGSILAPLFRGGELRANLDIAMSQRDQAAFAYRATVLAAFGEVENGLTGMARLREQVAALDRLVMTTRQLLAIAADRYREGYSDFLNLLDAQRSLYAAEQSLITARSDQLINVATLTAALGGGWEQAAQDRR